MIPSVRERRWPASRRPGRFAFRLLSGLSVLAMAVGLAMAASGARLFSVPSESMANTIRADDEIVAAHVTQVRRGDVIVEQQPGDGSAYFVRRVIGLPGDRVACCDAAGRITVNGLALTESYLYPGDPPSPFGGFAVTVPNGRLWLMGDDRGQALDSRQTGPLAVRVAGRVVLILRGGNATLVRTPQAFVTDRLAPADDRMPAALIGIALSGTAAILLLILIAIGTTRRVLRRRTRTAGNA